MKVWDLCEDEKKVFVCFSGKNEIFYLQKESVQKGTIFMCV